MLHTMTSLRPHHGDKLSLTAMPSPKANATDSPSRQLLQELNQLFISDQAELYSRLDRENAVWEQQHREALAAAAAAHERVRHSVELERQRLEEKVRLERERRDAEARREIEQIQRERAAREEEEKRLEVERAKEREQEQKRIADLDRQRREIDEAARARAQKQNEEAEKRLKEERAAEETRRQQANTPAAPTVQTPTTSTSTLPNANQTALQTSQLQTQPQTQTKPAQRPPTSSTTPQVTTGSWDPILENEHQQYLEIHKQLKELRSFMTSEAKRTPALKESMGEMRRQIRKCVGQLTHSKTQKGVNNQSINTLLTTLKSSLTISSPQVPITTFLPKSQAPTDTTAPSLLLYLLNIFSKALISQWIDEAGVNPDAADPVGVVASTIFANPAFQPNSISLISILLAKFHRTCPLLFGIYGPESTVQGKERLAWWKNESGGFVPQQLHFQRMTGLSAGYASISLRNYSKSKVSKNPYPDYHYWATVARLANTPVHDLTQTHFVVIKGLVDKYEERFIQFYGTAAVAVLRILLVELPTRLPEQMRKGGAVMGLVALAETEKKVNGLVL